MAITTSPLQSGLRVGLVERCLKLGRLTFMPQTDSAALLQQEKENIMSRD